MDAYTAVIGKDLVAPSIVEESVSVPEDVGSWASHDDCKVLLGAKPNDLESSGALMTAAAGKCSADGTAETKDWVSG